MVSSTSNPLENYKQILVQLDDGSTWKAEIQAGELVLIDQLTEPTSPKPVGEPEPAEADAEPSDDGEPSPVDPSELSEYDEDDDADYEDAPSHEKSRREVYDELFKGIKIHGSASTDDLMKRLPSRDGMPEGMMEKVKDPAFRARLSSVMLDNKYDRKLRGRTRGKLDMSRLHKVPMFSRNIFVQKQSRRGKTYNVILLVDESGSMKGSKATQAAEATLFLLKALDGLNINTAVIGFNRAVMVQKDWNRKSNYERIYNAVENTGRAKPWDGVSNAGYNNDYDAMHFAYEYFKKAPSAGEEILIMLSDGEPATGAPLSVADVDGKKIDFKLHNKTLAGYMKDDKEHLHHLVHAYPHVHSVGIGIFSGGWQVPDHFVIQNLEDLKPAVIKALNKAIKRG